AVGTEVTYVAQDDRGKQPIVFGATTAVVPKEKRAGKEKLVIAVKEKEKRKMIAVSESGRDTKKPRTQKKKEQKVIRKLVIHEEDDEET
ncbi:hypothetical protein A2U01_0082082, partial [Trifolium medium]|nr:hypothetical protein [Trifolium medium]